MIIQLLGAVPLSLAQASLCERELGRGRKERGRCRGKREGWSHRVFPPALFPSYFVCDWRKPLRMRERSLLMSVTVPFVTKKANGPMLD